MGPPKQFALMRRHESQEKDVSLAEGGEGGILFVGSFIIANLLVCMCGCVLFAAAGCCCW